MRKLNKRGRIFGRKKDQRNALLKSLASALILKEKIKTTEAKAKETAMFSEKLITKAKIGDLAAKRFLKRFFTEDVVKKIVNDIAPRYKNRNGGYTRILKLEPRKSDSAKMAIIELLK